MLALVIDCSSLLWGFLTESSESRVFGMAFWYDIMADSFSFQSR